MSRYELTDEVRATYKPVIAEFLNKIAAMTDDELCEHPGDQFKLDLSDTKLNPYTLGKLLIEEFGYEEDEQDQNGWEMDFWITYTKSASDITRSVEISGTGITFEVSLCVNIE